MRKLRDMIDRFELFDSILGILGVVFLLAAALVVQFFLKEEPCPLCLLQRAALINVGLALLLNLKFGNRVWHWGLLIVNALAGICVSMRQILLHIETPQGFGSKILGLHMYTWSFIAFALVILGAALLLMIYPERIFISMPAKTEDSKSR